MALRHSGSIVSTHPELIIPRQWHSGTAAATVILTQNSLFTDNGTPALQQQQLYSPRIHYSPTTALRHCGSNSYTHLGNSLFTDYGTAALRQQ